MRGSSRRARWSCWSHRSRHSAVLAMTVSSWLHSLPPPRIPSPEWHSSNGHFDLPLKGCATNVRLDRPTVKEERLMLKGFKEFLARGTSSTCPSPWSSVRRSPGWSRSSPTASSSRRPIDRGGRAIRRRHPANRHRWRQTIDLNVLLSAFINFILVAAVVYFLVMLPYKKLRERGEVEQAQDTELSLLTEIRDLLSSNGQAAGRHTSR